MQLLHAALAAPATPCNCGWRVIIIIYTFLPRHEVLTSEAAWIWTWCYTVQYWDRVCQHETSVVSTVKCLSIICVSWLSVVQSFVSCRHWSVNGTWCWGHCCRPTVRQTVSCPDLPGECISYDQTDQSSSPISHTAQTYSHTRESILSEINTYHRLMSYKTKFSSFNCKFQVIIALWQHFQTSTGTTELCFRLDSAIMTILIASALCYPVFSSQHLRLYHNIILHCMAAMQMSNVKWTATSMDNCSPIPGTNCNARVDTGL